MVKKTDKDSHFDVSDLKENIGRGIVRGISVTSLAQAVNFFVNITGTVFLARLLTPEDYGLIAMVLVIVVVLGLFKDMGLGIATMQKETINHEQVSTLFWINTGIGLTLGLILAVSAPLVSMFYGEPRLTSIVVVLAFVPIIASAVVQPNALLKRRMRFKALAAAEILGNSLSYALAIAMAFLGFGYWSLVGLHISRVLIICAVVWLVSGWRPGWPKRGAGVRSMLVFGGSIFGFNLTEKIVRKSDNLIIGWKLGAGPLGYYTKAYELLIRPINMLFHALNPVMYTSLSRLVTEPDRYRFVFKSILSKVALVMIPGMFLLIAISDMVINTVLGDQWTPAIRLFAILGFEGLVEPIMVAVRWLYVSQGRGGEMLRWGMLNSGITLTAIFVGIFFGVQGVAIAISGSGLFIRSPLLFWMAGRKGPVGMKDIYGTLVSPLLAGVAGFASVLAFRGYYDFPAGVEFLASVLLMGVVVLAVMLILPDGRTNLRQLLRVKEILSGKVSPAKAP